MGLIARLLVALVALAHAGFLALEMFLWTGPVGQAVFAMSPQYAAQTAVLAANQGLYNGFLAAGLLWGLWRKSGEFMVFFLICVIVAGIFGAFTAGMTILYIQALPGMIALIALLAARVRVEG